MWQIRHESCGWPPVTWPQSAASAAYLAASGTLFPPPSLIPTCGCVHVSVCLGAEESTFGSCYEFSARISGVFFGHVVSNRMRSGQLLLTCATSPTSACLYLLFLVFFSPLPFNSIVSTSTAWSWSINYVITPTAPSAILWPKKSLNSQDYVWKCEGRLGAAHAPFVEWREM